MKMTLTQGIQKLHRMKEGDVDYPSSSSDEYTLFTGLLGDAIDDWEGEEGVFWNELFVLLSDAADGDKTIAADTLTYTCPSDFRFLATYVRTTDSNGQHTYYNVIKPQEAELYKNTTGLWALITGNASAGYSITLGKQPTVGDTLEYAYYKDASKPTSGAEIFEMADPLFAVFVAMAQLHEIDGDGDRSNKALARAGAKLDAMKLLNEMTPWYQANQIPDDLWSQGTPGFGE